MLALFVLVALQATPTPIDLPRLLVEMTDRSALARFPEPPYRAHLVDGAAPAGSPPDPITREESVGGHFRATGRPLPEGERALLDTDGPGVITRIWALDPRGTLRVYVDDDALAPTAESSRPVIDVDLGAWLDGRGGIPSPLASAASSYLPIPFARHVLVTVHDPGRLSYALEWRRYTDATAVTSFAQGDLARHAATIAAAASAWSRIQDPPGEDSFAFHLSRAAPEGELLAQSPDLARGSRAVNEVRLRIDGADPSRALRACVLRMSFDGEETVAAPLGAFFGVPDEPRAIRTWFQSVTENGELVARFVMPYRASFALRIDNAGDPDLHISGRVRTIPWQWDERSLHFHASWRSARALDPESAELVTHARVQGRGLLVGEWLAIANPTPAWWGRGGERISIDGTVTHQGTGAESTFGLDASSTILPPLHGEARCDGPRNFGRTDLYRFRALDAVPFERELECVQDDRRRGRDRLDRAACVVYYARPGAQDKAPPLPPDPSDLLPRLPFAHVANAVEAESARIVASSPGIQTQREIRNWTDFSGGLQLAVRVRRVGDWIEFEIPSPFRRAEIAVLVTLSLDHGLMRFSIDGHPPEMPHDALFDPRSIGRKYGVERVELGLHHVGETFRLRIEAAGKDRTAEGLRHDFALDAIVIEPAPE